MAKHKKDLVYDDTDSNSDRDSDVTVEDVVKILDSLLDPVKKAKDMIDRMKLAKLSKKDKEKLQGTVNALVTRLKSVVASISSSEDDADTSTTSSEDDADSCKDEKGRPRVEVPIPINSVCSICKKHEGYRTKKTGGLTAIPDFVGAVYAYRINSLSVVAGKSRFFFVKIGCVGKKSVEKLSWPSLPTGRWYKSKKKEFGNVSGLPFDPNSTSTEHRFLHYCEWLNLECNATRRGTAKNKVRDWLCDPKSPVMFVNPLPNSSEESLSVEAAEKGMHALFGPHIPIRKHDSKGVTSGWSKEVFLVHEEVFDKLRRAFVAKLKSKDPWFSVTSTVNLTEVNVKFGTKEELPASLTAAHMPEDTTGIKVKVPKAMSSELKSAEARIDGIAKTK